MCSPREAHCTMGEIRVSAPGKIILHGEHAVVYGKAALAASLDLRTHLTLKKNNQDLLEINLPDIKLHMSWPTETLQEHLSKLYCVLTGCENTSELNSLRPELVDELHQFVMRHLEDSAPETHSLAVVACLYLYGSIAGKENAGLGSSAAYATCLSAALLILAGFIKPEGSTLSQTDRELINKWSFQAERIIHGRPSGIDNSVSSFGGVMKFQNGKITPLKRVPQLRVLLVNTKVPRSTKKLVAGVKERYDKYPSVYEPVLESIQAMTELCESTLSELAETNDQSLYTNIQELVCMNQQQLVFLGVSHHSLDAVCAACERHELRAKLTGAGGGGCAFTVLPPGVSEEMIGHLKQELVAMGYSCWETQIGGDGVTLHS